MRSIDVYLGEASNHRQAPEPRVNSRRVVVGDDVGDRAGSAVYEGSPHRNEFTHDGRLGGPWNA
ncbi:hypothetical protein BCGT_3220 [Mycobacterium tuberculosis variant bovis BCG str. ATCC 35743]|nr:hypothetical protein BCGT_3220 [Mycobacterium tuberculosis variant bovis BCG str. ATCC 35743]